MDVKGKRVTVMGLGLHGGALGTIEWLLEQGAQVTVTDLKTKEQLAPSVQKLAGKNIQFVLGEHREEDFVNADLVIRNPGAPKTSPYLLAAEQAGVPIEMDSSLFFLHSPTQDIIGITGSKGKTTTAKAITAVLQAGDKKVIEVGTDGASPLGKLKDVTTDTTVVFELSSWRLEALEPHKLSPHIAIITSIYREHLNTYDSFEDYIAAKKIIIRYQTQDDLAILNSDDDILREWESEIPGTALWYSEANAPKNTKLVGMHQARNLVPAKIIGKLYGVDESTINATLANFTGLPHRLEQVAVENNVTYINDSAATMPDATIAALEALKDKSLVVIIGGSDKKLEFEALAQKVSQSNIRALIWLPGNATERMQELLGQGPQQETVASMQEAVTKAAAIAQPNDMVLLSPGATSFGLFQHEFDRGDQFRNAVNHL